MKISKPCSSTATFRESYVRGAIWGSAFTISFLLGVRGASADTLTIDTSLSSLHFDAALINTNDGEVIGTFVGQGDVPQGSLSSGNGDRYPGYSNGLDVQLAGTINVTPAGFTIDGGTNIGVLNSGLWQPGLPFVSGIFVPEPTAGQVGAYLVTSFSGGAPDTFITARINNGVFNVVSSGPLTLGPGGTFDDPLGSASLAQGTISFSAINPFSPGGLLNSVNTIPLDTGTFHLSGAYHNGQLTMAVSGTLVIPATAPFDGLPVGIQITATGNVVTVAVPEPSSSVLLFAGAVPCLLLSAARGLKRGARKQAVAA